MTTAPTPAMLALGGAREAVEREWNRFLAALPSPQTGTAAWSGPTGCAGWTVADLAAHAVWGASMEADALRRYRLGRPGPAEGETVEVAAGPAVIAVRLVAAVDDLMAELGKLTDGDAGGSAPLPYGDVPLVLFWQILVMEAGVHAGDLIAGAGPAPTLAPDVVTATTAVLGAFLPVLGAGGTEAPPEGTVVALRGPSVDLRFRRTGGGWEAAPGAGGPEAVAITSTKDSAVLLHALGRLPADDPRLTLTGSPELAGAFKRWFPGP